MRGCTGFIVHRSRVTRFHCHNGQFGYQIRHSSTSPNVDNNKAFSKTLLLPETSFPMRNSPSKDEAISSRTSEELYRWQWENAKGSLFVFHDGPPYANGNLHMGHAMNKILKDIINRYQVLLGRRVHYLPGWDCHGLPIENKVLRELGKDMHEVSSTDIRLAAEAYAKDQAQSQMTQFRQLGIMADWSPESTYRTLDHDYEMRQLCIFQKMIDRGLIYRHYRPVHYSPSSRSALAEAELEYEDNHVSHSVFVSFDLDLSRTDSVPRALLDLVQSQPRVQLLVWTTTPWTLTANMGIAVNPEMTYTVFRSSAHPESGAVIVATERLESLKDLLESMGMDTTLGELEGSLIAGAVYRPLFAPLVQQDIPSLPILPSSHVTTLSGTGLVHCAPAHGHEDYHLFHTLGLIPIASADSLVCHVDGLGQFTPEVATVLGERASGDLVGKGVLEEGGKAMVRLLGELGVLKKIQRLKHRYPYDWKTNKPVIVTATSQWFANLDVIKDDAIGLLQNVKFVPEESRRRLESFVRQRSEWCISRQRVWGVPIPALYHLPTKRAVLDSSSLDHILPLLQEKGVHYWWDGPVEEFVPPHMKVNGEDVSATWQKGTDTMDVWFDSGTSWSMLQSLRGIDNTDGEVLNLSDVCAEGTDQHRGWFQSQLLTMVGSTPAERRGKVSPYGTLITHGMVLDEQGKKMSKSLGNIVSPLAVIHGGKDKKKEPAYGAEILRLWVASCTYWHDTSIGPKTLAQSEEIYRKLRNTVRFILGNLQDCRLLPEESVKYEDMSLMGRYTMHKLYELETHVRANYEAHVFSEVAIPLSRFVNTTLSSLYFAAIKDTLYADALNSQTRREVLTVLEHLLNTLTPMVAPILPHLAEEIHQIMHNSDEPLLSVFTQTWKHMDPSWHSPEAEAEMDQLLAFRREVLLLLEQARRDKHIGSPLEADVELITPNTGHLPQKAILQHEVETMKQLFNVSNVHILDSMPPNEQVTWEYVKTSSSPPLDVSTVNSFITESLGKFVIRVRPAAKHKCPRCWTHSREAEEILCKRCDKVIGQQD